MIMAHHSVVLNERSLTSRGWFLWDISFRHHVQCQYHLGSCFQSHLYRLPIETNFLRSLPAAEKRTEQPWEGHQWNRDEGSCKRAQQRVTVFAIIIGQHDVSAHIKDSEQNGHYEFGNFITHAIHGCRKPKSEFRSTTTIRQCKTRLAKKTAGTCCLLHLIWFQLHPLSRYLSGLG